MSSLEHSTYHSLLRISAVVVACVLVFESGLLSQATAQLSDRTELYLANAVGVSVGVAPNEFNQITAALTAREKELQEREMAVAQREITVGIETGQSGAWNIDRGTFILAAILFIQLVLIVLNYVLDFARRREFDLQNKSFRT